MKHWGHAKKQSFFAVEELRSSNIENLDFRGHVKVENQRLNPQTHSVWGSKT